VVLLPVSALAGNSGIEFDAVKQRFIDSEDVEISLANNSTRRIEVFGGGVYSLRTGERIVRLESQQRFIRPGESHDWVWSGDPRAGRFEARLRTSVGRLTDRFEKGAFFTLGFDRSGDTFVIWVREMKPIRQLREDLGRPQPDRRIVSGIVSRAKNYNPSWSFTMGPSSIVLGDAFIEVCDASPTYVENHRRTWMGERWCPWSSYVFDEGR